MRPLMLLCAALPTYPGAIHTRIGDDLIIAGEHHRLAYFVTGDPMAKVAGFFFRRWTRAGYPITVDGDAGAQTVISAFCTREGLQLAVVLTVHQGKTLGFTVLKDLWARAGPASEPLPVEGRLDDSVVRP